MNPHCRIRSISPTAKGRECPVFMKWLFERLSPPSDWITQRFTEVR